MNRSDHLLKISRLEPRRRRRLDHDLSRTQVTAVGCPHFSHRQTERCDGLIGHARGKAVGIELPVRNPSPLHAQPPTLEHECPGLNTLGHPTGVTPSVLAEHGGESIAVLGPGPATIPAQHHLDVAVHPSPNA